jgi:hypothetical protein
MKTFFIWLRSRCGLNSWPRLAEKARTSEQAIKNAANAPIKKRTSVQPLDGAPSWYEFRRMLRNLDEEGDPYGPFRWEACFAYGLARLMQEHAVRCYDLVVEHFCEPGEVKGFYLARIEEYKKWVREIPPHPWLDQG